MYHSAFEDPVQTTFVCFNGFFVQNNMVEWTDDLPVCRLSGVGFSTNQVYREDGIRREGHEFEDRSFHFRLEIRSESIREPCSI